MTRIGILGGTFDPPHNGHLALASAALDELGLNKIIFIPANIPPHKPDLIISPGGDRLNMLRLAIDSIEHFELSDIELRRKGNSYTIDTLSELKKTFSSDELYFIIGADNVIEMEKWHRPNDIFKLAKIAAANRPGYKPEGKFADNVVYFMMPSNDISSTAIRELVGANKSIHEYVPEAVEKYIYKHLLYKANG